MGQIRGLSDIDYGHIVYPGDFKSWLERKKFNSQSALKKKNPPLNKRKVQKIEKHRETDHALIRLGLE